MIKGTKLTGKLFVKAIQKLLKEMEKQKNKPPKIYKGKQTVKQLVKQGAGVQNIEITDQNIKSFERVARKYGIDFALKKDTSETPPRWLVFFKGRDNDALTAAFKEYTAKSIKRATPEKPSILAVLRKMKELVQSQVVDKVRNKDKGREL